jgi:hypothetical protein
METDSHPALGLFLGSKLYLLEMSKLLFRHLQDDRKVTQPIPDTCSICQKKKKNYTEIIKQKTILHQVLEMSTASTLSSLNTEGRPERFLSCTLPLAQENGEMYP